MSEAVAVVEQPVVELDAAAILGASDVVIAPVDVPEWGGRVYVKSLSGTAKERYLDSLRLITGKGKKQEIKVILVEAGAKLLVETLCNKGGVLLFNRLQIEALGAKSSKALQRCIDKASEINGLGDDAEADAGNDSGSTGADASSTD